MGDQVAGELARVTSRCGRRSDPSSAARASPAAIASVASKRSSASATPSTARTSSVATLAAVGHELIEGAERIPEAAVGGPGDRADGTVVDVEPLRLGGAPEHVAIWSGEGR